MPGIRSQEILSPFLCWPLHILEPNASPWQHFLTKTSVFNYLSISRIQFCFFSACKVWMSVFLVAFLLNCMRSTSNGVCPEYMISQTCEWVYPGRAQRQGDSFWVFTVYQALCQELRIVVNNSSQITSSIKHYHLQFPCGQTEIHKGK